MAETTTSKNGIPDSTTMSTLESTTHIPIAQLSPLLPASTSRSVQAVVTLTWPYSSRTGSVAFLLAEPDFRLRRIRGQVRVQFSGSSANAVAKSGITSGDEVILCLDGVEYLEPEPPNATPGRGVEFELKFTERLLLQFRPEESQDVKIINIDHPNPEPVVAPTPVLATEAEAETDSQILEVPSTPVPLSNRVTTNISEEYFSPVFLKRERISYGSMFEDGYDPFEEGDRSVRGRGRKRTRLSTTWRFTSRSPSPSPEVEEPVAAHSEHDIQEPASQHAPAMTDEGVQTVEEETLEVGTGVSAEATPTLEQSQPIVVDKVKVNGVAQAVDADAAVNGEPQIEEATTATMPHPRKQYDLAIPEVEEQQNPPDNADEKTPHSPQLRPLPSEGLPLVSPLATGQIETFNNHIQNDHNEDLNNSNVLAIYSGEADSPEQDDQIDAKEDPHSARPGSHTSNQPNSDQNTYQTSTILSGDEHGAPNMETTFTPHDHDEFEAGEGAGGAEQFFSHHNISGSDRYTSAHVYAETPGEQGQYVHSGLEEDIAQYNYPDPEEIHPQSNNWGAQSSMAYPELENSHESASHSPYPQQPSMPSMVRSQSNQSHQSLQSHQSPKSQPVDLTESSDEDEDADGYPEVEDNSQQYMSSSHLPVDYGEERSHDDEGEEYEDNTYDDEDKVDDYGEGYSDEYDENMELRGRDDYVEEDDNGSGNDYDEDNYSEDEMNNETPLQQHPPREPEVIDLLSSDDEDEPGSPIDQIGDDIEDEELESGQEKDRYEDQEENEDDENLDVVGKEIKNEISTTNPQPDALVEDESMEIESTLVNGRNDSIETGTQMPKIISKASESSFEAQVYVNLSRGESRGAQQSPPSQISSEQEATTDLDSPEPMDVETSLDNTSAATATHNLDGLFKQLEKAESKMQVEQGPSNTLHAISQNVAVDAEYDVEDFENEGNVQNPDGANADETYLQETQPSGPTEYSATVTEVSHGPTQRDNSENIINAALEDLLPSPIAVEVSNASTIPNSTEQSIKDRAAKSGWANLPKEDTLFSRTFGIDGANDTGEDADKNKNGQILYPTLPVTEPEDQQELIDESEQISQSQKPTHGTEITTNHGNDQLPTPDDTQMMNLDEDTFTSMSDLVQSQLQEEMGEMDEDSEMIYSDGKIAKDQSTDSIDDEGQSSFQEAIDEDQNVSPETDALDRDDDDAVEPKLEDFEVEFTNAEVTEIEKTEIIETEVEHVDKNPVENDLAEDEELEEEEVVEEEDVVEEEEVAGEFEEEDVEVDEEAPDEEVVDEEADKGGEVGNEKSDIKQIEADIRKAEMIEFETQQTLTKMAGDSILGQDMDMAEIAEESIEQTLEETEAVVEKTEVIVLEQIKGTTRDFSGSSRNRNRKRKSSGIESTETKSRPVSPRQTRSSKDLSPSPDFKRSRKGSATLSPRQTRSKKMEPVVEAFTLTTPTKSNEEDDMPSTRGSDRSRRSPSIIIDEEKTPEGHDASAEMALESLESPELPESPASPTKAGHHLRARACTDPKVRLTKYLRTDLSEYTTLKMLRFKMTSKLDILAIATSVPPEPRRVKSGPRHYTSIFTVTDQTIAPSGVVQVRIFRPYKDALPTPEIGDGVLLRDFSVLPVEGKGFALKSEETSSWAVFKDEGTEIEVRGPPVEYGHGEKKHMKELREWFHALDDDQKTKLDKVSKTIAKESSAKNTPEKGKK
ncbi:hypothetical protein SS1G_07829 [Sclerotinia sclerotiorum 1980 UF-70]|uniref:Telomeric single stranded DNA binding POT1/Cdc13 domain-containing protein n=2 Tax=Sclerotinia sclerotiorum (strain ATCC 18683 / 1980 / Ss-1) TaxID=665079 RepID=A7ER75_SCLS1|nr:hypothetical protein SS1G_07829 [Sclerotinia sclerotiorum 1980 UF-70]APA13534.1 hypothetical protein sscle_11g083040 [Sclerotinia sclerotiorum 1980 UF-70]EDN91967.1 hypothetical protein SS1G_07829 [Sclerotinia sclerotiorum 1980 UF-70]